MVKDDLLPLLGKMQIKARKDNQITFQKYITFFVFSPDKV